jgi:hypothetical protein
MLQGVAFAAAIDLTLVSVFWVPDSIYYQFWSQALVFTFIAASTAFVTGVLIRTNFQNRSGRKRLEREKEQHDR